MSEIPDRCAELAALHHSVFGPGPSSKRQPPVASAAMDVSEIIRRGNAEEDGGKFRRLMAGDITGYDSPSEADAALACKVAWYNRDPTVIYAVIQQSALFDKKWERADYRESTINGALALVRETYTPGGRGHQSAGAIDGTRVDGAERDDLFPPADAEVSVLAASPAAEAARQPLVLLTPDEVAAAVRDTFIDQYVAYAARRTSAPAAFHEALATVALSVIVGRRAVLRLSTGDVYAILWVLILAESTIFKKSTAMDLINELIKAVDRDLITPNDFTPQRFLAILAERDGCPLLFMRDEFSGFYDSLNRLDFMAGLKESLLNVYDGRPFRREKMKPPKNKKGDEPDASEWRFDIREPFLAIGVATTMERFLGVAPEGDVHSGFLPRFAIVPAPPDRPEWLSIRELDAETEQLRDDLIASLRCLSTAEVRLTCDQAALARFDKYARDLEEDAWQAADRNLAAIVAGRSSWMALRVAMLLAVADGTQRVSVPHVLRGIEMAEGWRLASLTVLAQLAPSKMERKVGRALELIERHGLAGVKRRDVMRACRFLKKEMDVVEETLVGRGEIVVDPDQTSGGVSPHYRATKRG